MKNNPSPSPNHFKHGFILGGLLGAGAFYLFGTQSGSKLKKRFIEEFHQAKAEIEANPEFYKTNAKIHKAVQKIEQEITQKPEVKEVISQTQESVSLVKKLLSRLFPPQPISKTDSKRYFKKK